ncbi:MAG: hypothetical protein MI923_05645 [Phycisphaerales bacterium]|nr:hypothetical protein [Phycisphaerales bacterium]
MILESGDKILVVHRRLFDKDENRYFVGTVEAFESGIARVTGYSFVRDFIGGLVFRKPDPRTKLLSISSGTLLVYVLSKEVPIEALEFVVSDDGGVTATDGKSLHMNLSEKPRDGHL